MLYKSKVIAPRTYKLAPLVFFIETYELISIVPAQKERDMQV